MKISEAKKLVEREARKYFPQFDKKLWTYQITAWDDKDFQIEYYHSLPIDFRLEITIRYNIHLHYTTKDKFIRVFIDFKEKNKPDIEIFVLKKKKIK